MSRCRLSSLDQANSDHSCLAIEKGIQCHELQHGSLPDLPGRRTIVCALLHGTFFICWRFTMSRFPERMLRNCPCRLAGPMMRRTASRRGLRKLRWTSLNRPGLSQLAAISAGMLWNHCGTLLSSGRFTPVPLTELLRSPTRSGRNTTPVPGVDRICEWLDVTRG